MQEKPSALRNFLIRLFIGWSLLMLTNGCFSRVAPSTPFYLTINDPNESTPDTLPTPLVSITSVETPLPTDRSNNLLVITRIECACNYVGGINASLTVTPLNGLPPYKIPNFDFSDSQVFANLNIGDVLQITLNSSDYPPLQWIGSVKIECDFIPACQSVPFPTKKPGNGSGSNDTNGSSTTSSVNSNSSNSNSLSSSSGVLSSSSSSVSSGSSSSVSSSSSSSVSSSSSSSVSSSSSSVSSSSSSSSSSSTCNNGNGNGNCNGQIPDCPPPGQGGTDPPGICKKP